MILKSSEREIPMFMYTHFYISLTRPKFFAFKTNQFDDKKMMWEFFSFCLFYVPPHVKKYLLPFFDSPPTVHHTEKQKLQIFDDFVCDE